MFSFIFSADLYLKTWKSVILPKYLILYSYPLRNYKNNSYWFSVKYVDYGLWIILN